MARVAYAVITSGNDYRRFPEATRPGGRIPSPRAGEALSSRRRHAGWCAALPGLVPFNAAYVSEVSAYVWSECPFLALVSLGLFLIRRHRTFGWGVLLFVVSWSVRCVGMLTVPLVGLVFCQLVIVERHPLRTVLAANLVPLVVAAVLVFNRINFGFWIRTSLSGPSPTLVAAATDYLTTLFGFLLKRRLPLGPGWTAFIVAAILATALSRTWAAVRSRRGDLSLRLALARIDPWLAWSLPYSASMIWLMSHSDLFGTNRLVTPVFGAVLIVFGKWLAGMTSSRVRLLTLIIIAGLAGESDRPPLNRHAYHLSPPARTSLPSRTTRKILRTSREPQQAIGVS